jgi:hypothetical protein
MSDGPTLPLCLKGPCPDIGILAPVGIQGCSANFMVMDNSEHLLTLSIFLGGAWFKEFGEIERSIPFGTCLVLRAERS